MNYKKLLELTSAIIIFFTLLFVYTKFLGPIPFTINNINTNTSDVFQAQGSGKVSGVPDTSIINIGVTKQATTALEAQELTNQTVDQIIDVMKSNDISEDKIKTTNYSLNPDYSFSNETQKIIGYSVTQNIEIEADIDKTNNIIDSATKNGANLVGNISFKLNEEKELELKNKARKDAVKKAKTSAEGLAKAAGIRLGKIINVTESSTDSPRPIFLETSKTTDSMNQASETNITPGESSIEINVILTYQIK